MAEDNPFLSFFESVGTGMEARQRRRSLMERARAGEDVDVPSLGATILSGISRAATPANTRLAQDELKLRAANYALDRKIQQDRYQAQAAAETAKRAEEAKKSELKLRDTVLLQSTLEPLYSAAERGDISALYRAGTPKFEDPNSYSVFNNTRESLINASSTAEAAKVNDKRSRLIELGYAQAEVTGWPSWKVNEYSKLEDGRFEDVAARSMLLPPDKGQALMARIRQPLSLEDRSNAFNELYKSTSSLNLGDSPLAKIYQGRQAALNQGGDVKAWDDLITKVTSGEIKSGASITLPNGTKINLGDFGEPQIEDKQALQELTLQLPQQLALMNTVDRMLSSMEESELGLVGAARGYAGPAALKAEGLANFFGVKLPDVLSDIYSPDIEALTQNRVALAQAIKSSVRTDVGPISNYEDIRLAPIISTLENPSSTKEELVNSVSSLRNILNTKQFINAHALGKVPNLLVSVPNLRDGLKYLNSMRSQLSENIRRTGSQKGIPIVSDDQFAAYERLLADRFPEQYKAVVENLKRQRK